MTAMLFFLLLVSKPAIGSNTLKIPTHHRNIPGVIQRTGKIFQPCFNVSLVDIGHAHPFNTDKESAGMLRRDHDAIPHYPHLDGHPVNKPRLRHPFTVQTN
ncbi:Uncharacterised protein [Salmonella enterica subsp. enterica serovar Typhi]|nr:Uncharacterised protein [Salmonella enterica subsp. enterica serovar Typhi]